MDLGHSVLCLCVRSREDGKGYVTGTRADTQATRAFLDLIKSPRVAIPFISDAKGSLDPRAGFMRGNLGVTALTRREVSKVLDILDMGRNNCPSHQGTRNENLRDGS